MSGVLERIRQEQGRRPEEQRRRPDPCHLRARKRGHRRLSGFGEPSAGRPQKPPHRHPQQAGRNPARRGQVRGPVGPNPLGTALQHARLDWLAGRARAGRAGERRRGCPVRAVRGPAGRRRLAERRDRLARDRRGDATGAQDGGVLPVRGRRPALPGARQRQAPPLRHRRRRPKATSFLDCILRVGGFGDIGTSPDPVVASLAQGIRHDRPGHARSRRVLETGTSRPCTGCSAR